MQTKCHSIQDRFKLSKTTLQTNVFFFLMMTKKADFALVAYAYKHHCMIVAHESASYGINYSKKRVKIPDICKKLNISCINTFDFLQEEKVCFILQNPPTP